VTRFASMTGHHCVRRFGWDCHGLPVEHEIDKKLSKLYTNFHDKDLSSVLVCLRNKWESRCVKVWYRKLQRRVQKYRPTILTRVEEDCHANRALDRF